MTDIVFLVEADNEGGYIARSLGYSILTQAETWDELEMMIEDAVRCHFEGDEELG